MKQQSTQATPKQYHLIIANSRGKRPVMTDIKKARNLIIGVIGEINPCEGKEALRKCDLLLWDIMHDNDKPKNPTK